MTVTVIGESAVTNRVIVTALGAERAALAGRAPAIRVLRCGMGPVRARRSAAALAAGAPAAVMVAGVAGALDRSLRPGDIVVATEVIGAGRRIELPGARLVAAVLTESGFTVRTGPLLSVDQLVDGARRTELADTGALAVDMESAAFIDELLSGCRPALAVVRVVSDTAEAPLVSPRTLVTGARALRVLRQIGPALARWTELAGPRTVRLAGPRSFCAGVERAIDIVERALEHYPLPVYVRREIVHNEHVVADLRSRGAVFVHELDEVPDGSTVIFSAHGVGQPVRDEADRRGLTVIDATCPLVAKVHAEVRRFAGRGDSVLLVGHDGHDETEGTLAELPGQVQLVQNAAEARRVRVADPSRVSVVTQTTLDVDEVSEVVAALQERLPMLNPPPEDDICYATTNRQQAVRAVAAESDVVLVVGSATSSNSLRLVEVARRCGAESHLISDASSLTPAMLIGRTRIGLTAGASAPPVLVEEVLGVLAALGPIQAAEVSVAEETLQFSLPKEVGG